MMRWQKEYLEQKQILPMQVMAINAPNTRYCSDCQDLLKKVKVAQSTIKFYQDEINKYNRLNAQLKVQKIDFINEISELRTKLRSFNENIAGQTYFQLERLRKQQLEMTEEIDRLKKQQTKSRSRKVSLQGSIEEQKYKLQSQLRSCKVSNQQLVYQVEELKEELRKKQTQSEKFQRILDSQRKLRILMEDTIKNEPGNFKEQTTEIYEELKEMQKRFNIKSQQVKMLSSKLRNLQTTNTSIRSTSESKHSQFKTATKQKDAQLKNLRQKLTLEEKQKLQYKSQLKSARLQLQQSNRLFTQQLTLVQLKMTQYNQYLQQMQDKIKKLQQQNEELKGDKIGMMQYLNKQIEQINRQEQQQSSKAKQIKYLNLTKQNQQLKNKVNQLTFENNRIQSEYLKLDSSTQQSNRQIQSMKMQALSLFKKIEQFESKVSRNGSKLSLGIESEINQNQKSND